MLKILVVADDLTGAAEVAGIAKLAGFSVAVVTHLGSDVLQTYEVVVLDTHTRALSPSRAARQLADHLDNFDAWKTTLVYKKTDSVLRGNVAAELRAIMHQGGFTNALLLPANPSKGRTITQGVYYIDGVPLHETDFQQDPNQPARSSQVEQLLGEHAGALVYYSCPQEIREEVPDTIIMTDVETTNGLDKVVDLFQETRVLYAGGSDFFAALLRVKLRKTLAPYDVPSPSVADQNRCFIIGSYTSSSAATLRTLKQRGYVLHQLSGELLGTSHATGRSQWLDRALTATEPVVFARPDEPTEGAVFKEAITSLLVAVAQRIVADASPGPHLLIEGGATASGLIRAMDWSTLRIEQVYPQGAVSLSAGAPKPLLTIKPGSYAWPEAFLQ
ncbi:MAG: four-carbon acid sugar kinase family protein [Tunicatimonas sp.]